MPKAHDELAHYWCGMLIFFLPLLLLLRLLLGLFFLANNSLGNLEMQDWEHG